MDILSLQQEMSKILKPKRYLHVLGVEFTCASLAMRYHADLKKAQIAGLLHDCAKHLDDETQLAECTKYELHISEVEARVPYLLHGKLGAYYAKTRYQIEDQEILDAITYHTTGRPEMSLLEKIVYTADYIEPSRNAERIKGMDEIRAMAFVDIDQAIVMMTKNTMDYITSSGGEFDQTTVATYHYYQALVTARKKAQDADRLKQIVIE